MFQTLLKSPIINSWFNSIIVLFSSLIAIPIVITKLSVEEINIWFLYTVITALGQSILFGFNLTFSRFISYAYSGIKINEFRHVKNKKDESFSLNINNNEFNSIYYLMRKVYFFLGSIYFLITLIIGYYILNLPIQALDNQMNGWISGMIVLVSSTLVLLLGYNQNFLYGIHKVALLNRILGLVNFIGLFIILIVLFAIPSLISIVAVYRFITIVSSLIVAYYAYKEHLIYKKEIQTNKRLEQYLIKLIWDSTWRSGMTTILANFIRYASTIIVSQLLSPVSSATFLFTVRLFDIIENFTTVTFYSKVPYLTTIRSRGHISDFKKELKKIQYISYGIFFIGYILLITIGKDLVHLIDSNVNFASTTLIVLFSFSSLLSRWAGFTAMVSNISNHIIDYQQFFVITIVYFIMIYLFYDDMRENVFPFALIIGFIVASPILILNVYKTFNTSFIQYEKILIIPLLILLMFINLIYFYA